MGALDDLLPIRRIKVDGEVQPFVRDIEFDGDDFELAVDESAGVLTVRSRLFHADARVVEASGDDTGATDGAAINAAIAAAKLPHLEPGQRYWSDEDITDISKLRCVGGSAGVELTAGGLIVVRGDEVTIYPDAVPGAPFSPLPSAPTTIIMNGQSNAAAIPPAGTVGFSAMVQYLGTDLKGWSDSTHTFVNLVDGSANMRANAGGLGTGAGPGGGQILTRVMREIADSTGGTVYSISHAYSSQAIDYFRRGSATMAYYEDGTQHATKNNYTLIRDEAVTSGRTVDLIIFIQGESDSGVTRSTYYTKLRELVEDWAEDFPSAHVLIVSCAGSSLFDGVRAAQRQICDENPHCHYVKTTDMYGSTAFYGGNQGPHYTSFVGYEEVFRRIIAKLRGLPDRPDVPVVQHADICAAWKNGYGHARTLVAGPAVSSWTDYIDGKHATEATNRPAHTVADANFAGYPSVQFTGTSSHKLTSSATDETSQDFSVFAVMKADDLSAIRYLFALDANATADRAGLMYPAFSGQAPWFETNGVGAVFTGGTAVSTSYQTIGVTYNAAATQAKLYVNGVLESTITVAATETFTNAVLRLGVAPGGAANFWTGRLGWFLLGVGIVADATAMANCHAWAQVEFKKGLAYA